MIASGEKKEEYREITDYWIKRISGKGYKFVTFYLGYSKDRPSMTFAIKEIVCDEGKEEWGALPGETYFVIKLGERL